MAFFWHTAYNNRSRPDRKFFRRDHRCNASIKQFHKNNGNVTKAEMGIDPVLVRRVLAQQVSNEYNFPLIRSTLIRHGHILTSLN